MKHPLMNENAHDWANSVDDVDNWFNPNKQIGSPNYSNTGAYVQKNATPNKNAYGQKEFGAEKRETDDNDNMVTHEHEKVF